MPQPTVIQGPAFVVHDSYAFYTQGNVTIRYVSESWSPRVASFGDLGPRHKSRRAEVSFTPAGMVTAATIAKYWPKAPANVGTSIMNGTVAVIPHTGSKVTFARGGISQYPSATLSPLATIWGAMTLTCLGDPTLEPTNAAYFQAIAATTGDTSFDETKIISPRYTATLGSVFTDAEPDDAGFVVEPVLDVAPLSCANFGQVDLIIASLGMRARFKPVDLTEAEIATVLALQDTGAKRPGDPYGSASDLVISGTGLALSLKNMGPVDAGLEYGTATWRQGEMTFANKLTATTGVPNALYSAA